MASIKDSLKNVVTEAAKNVVEDKVEKVIRPEKAAEKENNTRDVSDAKRIYDILDAKEERIRAALAKEEITKEDEKYLMDCLDRYEEIREKVKDRVHKRRMAEKRFEHEINKDAAELDLKRQQIAVEQKKAEAETLKARNEGRKAGAILTAGLVGTGLMAATAWHGTNTGAAVEMYQNGSLTSTTSKNWCPKFSDVGKIIFAPKV